MPVHEQIYLRFGKGTRVHRFKVLALIEHVAHQRRASPVEQRLRPVHANVQTYLAGVARGTGAVAAFMGGHALTSISRHSLLVGVSSPAHVAERLLKAPAIVAELALSRQARSGGLVPQVQLVYFRLSGYLFLAQLVHGPFGCCFTVLLLWLGRLIGAVALDVGSSGTEARASPVHLLLLVDFTSELL